MTGRRAWSAVALLVLLLATVPAFFEIYRTAAFRTVPYDDYAPYLLALVGDGGSVPGAPYAYRVLSVAVAVPFYLALPVYAFSKLPDVDPASLRATQALAMVSYLSLLGVSATIRALALRRGASEAAAWIAALVAFLLGGHLARTGVDPFAVLVVGLLLLALDTPAVFVPGVLLTIGVNEKIPFVFAAMLGARALVDRRAFAQRGQLVGAVLAVVGYFVVRQVVRAPGLEAQTDPGAFVDHLVASARTTLSAKGLVLNVLPVGLVGLLVAAAAATRARTSFRLADAASLVVLVLLGALADVAFNLGRVAMYTFPLYLPAAAVLVDELTGTGRVAGVTSPR